MIPLAIGSKISCTLGSCIVTILVQRAIQGLRETRPTVSTEARTSPGFEHVRQCSSRGLRIWHGGKLAAMAEVYGMGLFSQQPLRR